MSQQTFSSGATQVAEPPAPVLPEGDFGDNGDDSRRKLMIVGALAGVLVLAIVAFFLLKGGSSSGDNGAFVAPHHPTKAAPAAAQPRVIKLPKRVVTPVGRDPFKALYVAPVAGGGATSGTGTSTPTTTSGGPTTTTSGGTTTTPPAAKVTYHPVWIQLRAVTATTATFDVGYSNGKTLKAVRYSGIKPLHTFATRFELLSIRKGVVNVKFGDGSPFQLDKSHNTMVVD